MDPIQRFGEYANAFEAAFKSDDWSVIEPYFTEDAVYEIIGGEPLAGRHEGREAIFAYFKRVLDEFDRRFEARELDLLEGPEVRDGSVWMSWRGTYRIAGAPDLVIEGEETASFEGDRIQRLEDRYPPDASKTMLSWMGEHGAKLRPSGG